MASSAVKRFPFETTEGRSYAKESLQAEKILRRRRRSGQQDSPSSLSSIRSIESGDSIPDRLSWRCGLTSLSGLRKLKPGLSPSHFDGRARLSHHNRYPYIAHVDTSGDGALLSVAGNDGRIEVHELSSNNGDTRRLSLIPAERRLLLASCAWASHRDSDYVLACFENRGDLWEYNLQTCREDRPSRVYKLFQSGNATVGSQQGVTDLAAIDSNCIAAATGAGYMKLVDVRIKNSKQSLIGSIETGMSYALIASAGFYIYSADCGEIALHDRRISNVTTAGHLVKSFGARAKAKQSEIGRKHVGRRDNFSFNFLRVLPESVPGCVAYQASDGAVGFTDLAGRERSGVHVLEKDPRAYKINGEQGLEELGTFERDLDRAWFLSRRRGDIIRSPFGRGWVAIAPLVSRPGIRIVRFHSDADAQSFDFLNDHYYSCVSAPDRNLDRLVVCDVRNRVAIRQMGYDSQNPKDTLTCQRRDR